MCPSCALPIAPGPRVPARAELSCGFCDHHASATQFLRRDVVDAPGNDVILVARLS